MPPIDPGDYASITLQQKAAQVDDAAVEEALSNLRERAARYEPVEGRGVEMGDSVVMDLVRTATPKAESDEPLVVMPGSRRRRGTPPSRRPTRTKASRSTSAPPPTRPASTTS